MARTKKKQAPLKISWSAISAFLSCQRKFELSYLENLQAIPGVDSRNLMLGSAVHAGIEAALLLQFEHRVADPIQLERAAIEGIRAYMLEATIIGKKVYNYEARMWVEDFDYYSMTTEVHQLAIDLIRFHLPLIGIGTRFKTASIDDVLTNSPPGTYRNSPPAIEWRFERDIGENTILSGMIDSILWDVASGQYILVDWKTRGSFPRSDMALLDGQAHLYAAIVNQIAYELGGEMPIRHVAMWQLRTKTPSPASISTRTMLPNTGAASYDTTWDYWVATLPAGIDPERYRAIMEPKMKQPEDFQQIAHGLVTDFSSKAALDNVQAAAKAIREAILSEQALPAVLSSNACKSCDFVRLCMNAFRYGGDVSQVLEESYQVKTGSSGSIDIAEIEE